MLAKLVLARMSSENAQPVPPVNAKTTASPIRIAPVFFVTNPVHDHRDAKRRSNHARDRVEVVHAAILPRLPVRANQISDIRGSVLCPSLSPEYNPSMEIEQSSRAGTDTRETCVAAIRTLGLVFCVLHPFVIPPLRIFIGCCLLIQSTRSIVRWIKFRHATCTVDDPGCIQEGTSESS